MAGLFHLAECPQHSSILWYVTEFPLFIYWMPFLECVIWDGFYCYSSLLFFFLLQCLICCQSHPVYFYFKLYSSHLEIWFLSFILSMFLLNFLNIQNIVITVLMSLSSNSNICVTLGLLSIAFFFSFHYDLCFPPSFIPSNFLLDAQDYKFQLIGYLLLL